MTDVLETLHEDHQMVSELFEKLKDTTGGSEKTRASLLQKIKHELLAHTEFEEKVFYPAVREKSAEARQHVEKALKEHEEVEDLLEQIEQLEPTSETFVDEVTQLQQAVLDHVQHEEQSIFPLAQKAIEADEAEEMSRRHDEMVEKHMQQAHV